ncbi:MAG TPA: cation:proton antiporter [Pyrinomonadaceae bacterium]|nr:cation:proton antiporter [Pyrinomonadaceae bacterium]
MPHSFPIFDDLVLILLAAVPIVFICHRLRLPTLVGFMLTGIIIGPYGLGLLKELEAIEVLAEIGVILLLFTIGLEFSLKRMMEMKRLVFLGGGLQVVLTILVVSIAAYFYGKPINQAIFYGFLFTLSSTAIVLKSYVERAEIDAPHGRAGVGMLLFQDLSIIPMMLLIPLLGGQKATSPTNVAITLGTAGLAIIGIIFVSRTAIPFLLKHIVSLRSPEVFIITVVLICLGTSWIAAHFGISLALGAFLAGMAISESEYSHQIVADILPFRDIFNSLFFISIGMLLSLGALGENLSTVLLYVGFLIVGKALLILAVIFITGFSLRVAVMTGLGLAQVGEFSFVLAKAGVAEGLLSGAEYQNFLAASIISMIATPFLIMLAPRLGYFIQSFLKAKLPDVSIHETISDAEPEVSKHVVIVGYGLNGRNLARVLKSVKIPYVVLEMNAEAVWKAKAQGEKVYFGDATRREVLHHVGVDRASIIVLAISDPTATRHTVSLARELNPSIHIIVRTRYLIEMNDLMHLGANEVIPEEFETSIEIFSRVLQEYGVSRYVIEKQIARIRREGYEMLRTSSTPLLEMQGLTEAFSNISSETILISENMAAVGKTIGELNLRQRTNSTINAIVRDGLTEITPGADFRIEAGDILVILGKPEDLEKAEKLIYEMKIEEIG